MSAALWIGTGIAAAALVASQLAAPSTHDVPRPHQYLTETTQRCDPSTPCPEWFSPVAKRPAITAKVGGAVGVAPPGSGVRYYEGKQDTHLRGTP